MPCGNYFPAGVSLQLPLSKYKQPRSQSTKTDQISEINITNLLKISGILLLMFYGVYCFTKKRVYAIVWALIKIILQ